MVVSVELLNILPHVLDEASLISLRFNTTTAHRS